MNATIINTALEMTTGRRVSEMAINASGFTVVQVAKNFSNTSLPVHFSEVKEGSKEDIKEGFVLLTNNDVITFNGHYFQGINRIYSAREVKEIISTEENVLVK